MKTLLSVYMLLSLIFLGYLALPNFEFPAPPPGALQSTEPADTETPFRRAYFTDYTRQEVLNHYKSQIERSSLLNIIMPTYLLNYPPEDAQTIIRDQTRSTFLQEIVHPFRESLYINGFEPKDKKDTIFIQDKEWRQKIIVRYVASRGSERVFAGIISVVCGLLILLMIKSTYRDLLKAFKNV